MSFILFSLLFTYQWGFHLALIIVKQLIHNKTTEQFDDEDALFGPHVTDDDPISGYLYASSPLDGCVDSVPLPPNASHSPIPFICLIKRGKCNFDDKVRAAQRGGYSAVIVYNHMDDSIFPMGSQSALPVNIPSFMVGLSDGKKFLNYTTDYEKYVFEIYPNHAPGFEVYLIPILSMLGVFILGVIGMFIYRWNEQRRRRRRRCLTSSQVSSLPVIKFIKGQSPDGACVICLDDYENDDKLRRLPCGHIYHAKCIDPWLLKNSRFCPICKRPVYPRQARERRRLPFLASFRHWSGRDNLEDRLISDSDSYEGAEDENNDVESYTGQDHQSGPSYGTIVPPRQREHDRPARSWKESTPLLLPNRPTSISHSWHSEPSHLDCAVRTVEGPAGGSSTEAAAITSSGSAPPIAIPKSRLSAPALYHSFSGTCIDVDPANVIVHYSHSPVNI